MGRRKRKLFRGVGNLKEFMLYFLFSLFCLFAVLGLIISIIYLIDVIRDRLEEMRYEKHHKEKVIRRNKK